MFKILISNSGAFPFRFPLSHRNPPVRWRGKLKNPAPALTLKPERSGPLPTLRFVAKLIAIVPGGGGFWSRVGSILQWPSGCLSLPGTRFTSVVISGHPQVDILPPVPPCNNFGFQFCRHIWSAISRMTSACGGMV